MITQTFGFQDHGSSSIHSSSSLIEWLIELELPVCVGPAKFYLKMYPFPRHKPLGLYPKQDITSSDFELVLQWDIQDMNSWQF